MTTSLILLIVGLMLGYSLGLRDKRRAFPIKLRCSIRRRCPNCGFDLGEEGLP